VNRLKRVVVAYLTLESIGVILVLPLLLGGLAGVDAIYLTGNRFVVLFSLVAGITGGYYLAVPVFREQRKMLRKAVAGR